MNDADRESVESRFWRKVDIPHGGFGCWEWTGAKQVRGYGVFNANRRTVRAHRFVLYLVGVDVLQGHVVMHTCDNTSCCNPQHLLVGTQSENLYDSVTKGRWNCPKGTMHLKAKLTEDQVRQIRNLYEYGGISTRKLADRFQLAHSSIWHIVRRTSWKGIN